MKKDFNKKPGSGKFKKDDRGPRDGAKKPFKKDFSDRPKRSDDDRGEKKRSFGNDDHPRKNFDSDRPKRSFNSDKTDRPFRKREDGDDRPKRSYDNDRPKRSFDSDKPKRSFNKREDGDDRPKRSYDNDRPKRAFDSDKPKRPFNKREDGEDRPKKPFDKDKPRKGSFAEKMNRAFNNIDDSVKKEDKPKREPRQREEEDEQPKRVKKAPQNSFDRSVGKIRTNRGTDMDAYVEKKLERAEKPTKKRRRHEEDEEEEIEVVSDIMPLNKYISHSGECSRREAAELVKQGKVKVNGELVTDPGHKVNKADNVTVAGKKMTLQSDHVYILLNKPKGFLTTTDDPEGRKTVMELVANSGADRVFPVGRLDRNTTGLLLLTNDGALAQKLSHPSYSIKKIYQVTLDKPVTKADFEKIAEGIDLDDGRATVDAIAYLEKKNEIGLEIHIGRNRIVRRIFESLGYQVEKLDRVMYAGLTKKNLPRSKWRFLEPKEIILLKHFKV